MQMLYSFAKNRLDAKESSVTKIEQKFHAHSIKIREHQNEMRRTDPRNMNKKGVKNNENQAFMNIFKVSFDQKIVNINEATENAEIVSNKNFLNEEKYRISNEYYENESKSYEGEVSSSAESLENKIKQLSNKVSNKFRSVFSGENKGKQKKPPHFYLAFKDVHPSWSLIGCALTYGIITTFGVIFNSSVIVATYLTKSFRGTVNFLLALYSFFELVHQLGHFLLVYNAFSGQNFIVIHLEAKILFIPVIGLGGITPAMFFTGIDRLIGIAFSEFHDNLKKRLYLALLAILSVSYGLCFSISVYQNAIMDGDQMTTGAYFDFLRISPIFLTTNLLLTSMTCIIYLLLGIAVHIKASGLPSADSFNRRTFRALFCIISVNIGGYFFSLIFYIFLIPTISSPITAWFCIAITAIPLNIGSASSGPILYFTSTEYRQAFQTVFPFVFKRILNPNRVISLQNMPPFGTTQC
ncbi:hypothetical protein niasHT_033396 [Heterodera trifolii]|uniref:G protein-coupled receptor n=1 Tax=Heterodera trifolii TaxID=157864 RepID=A0ABD2HR44_9BILA